MGYATDLLYPLREIAEEGLWIDSWIVTTSYLGLSAASLKIIWLAVLINGALSCEYRTYAVGLL
jgi:hypothetical protein